MYGYIRPLKGELKVTDYELFKRSYCGLCNSLGKIGRLSAKFIINYDFLFLSMLLSKQDKAEYCKTHCPARLCAKVKCIVPQQDMTRAAEESIILAYWKLKDGIQDHNFFPGLKYRAALLMLKPAYKKASKQEASFASQTQNLLTKLNTLEENSCSNLDMVADKFACILQSAADCENDVNRQRILQRILYHVGRVVYILDAVDDLSEDIANGTYNPLFYRFDIQKSALNNEQTQIIRETLIQSQREAAAAFELLDKNIFYNILANIIFLGIPWAIESVLNGTWQKTERRHIHYERSL